MSAHAHVAQAAATTHARAPVSLLLMAASGFAGLGYQIVWTQQSALALGHESAAVLAVVAAFFGGLSAGALTLGPRIERSRDPRRWYVGCELLIAVWSLVLIALMAPFSAWLLRMTGVSPMPGWQWGIAFSGTFLALLPATAAMGATLPAMERMTAQLRDAGRSIALLYASNTLGAVIGVLAAAFWLVPLFGLARTAAFCVVLNLLCALMSCIAFPRDAALPAAPAAQAPSRRIVLLRLAATGLLGIGYEVLVVRVLAQVAEDTVYTFAMLLAVYLVSSAAGAALYQRSRTRGYAAGQGAQWRGEAVGERLLCALALACLIGTATLWGAQDVRQWVLEVAGASMAVAIGAEALPALLAFALPALLMGALFSHLCARASECGISFGRAIGVNTLGAAMAPLLLGVLALPAAGPKLALLSISFGYLLLVARHAWRRPAFALPAAGAATLAIWAPALAFIDVPDGGRIISYQDGVMASVSVVEDGDGIARLHINNRQQEGSSATLRVDGRQGLLPVLLHPAPQRALFLGLGTGITAATAALDPNLRVDAVELLPEVIAASGHFLSEFEGGIPNPRLQRLAADARRYVRASTHRYEVIVSDNFHPARSGSGSLYTVEHFSAVRQRLSDDGVFCQWLPLHQLDLETLRSIVKSFLAAYPGGFAMLASNSLETPVLGLIGRGDDGRFDVAALRARALDASFEQRLAEVGIEDEFALWGSFVSGPQALQRFAANAPANTDDHPVVAYLAPRATYVPDSSPRERLMELLGELALQPAELVEPPQESGWSSRLAAYWVARDLFIEAGRDVMPASDVRTMLAQVREPLLAVLRTSPDFRPAYDPLLRMAAALSAIDEAAARALLAQLADIQPARPEASRVLDEIGAASSHTER